MLTHQQDAALWGGRQQLVNKSQHLPLPRGSLSHLVPLAAQTLLGRSTRDTNQAGNNRSLGGSDVGAWPVPSHFMLMISPVERRGEENLQCKNGSLEARPWHPSLVNFLT